MTPVLSGMKEQAGENRAPVLITAGPRICTIESIEQKTGSASGEDYLEFILKPIEEKFAPAVVYNNFTLQNGVTPQGSPMKWALFNFLESMGHDPEQLEGFDTDVLLARHVVVHVVHQSYGGTVRNKASKVEGTPETTQLDINAGLVEFAPVEAELVPA